MPATDLCHPTENRPLAVEEYRRVQGFPDDWRICGDIMDAYRQIGNAVPVALGEAIGRADTADKAPDSRLEGFPARGASASVSHRGDAAATRRGPSSRHGAGRDPRSHWRAGERPRMHFNLLRWNEAKGAEAQHRDNFTSRSV